MTTPAAPLWLALNRPIVSGRRPRVMGIVNVTPDSFSDGGNWLDPSAALAHARRLAEEGADLIDIGGESSRPGADIVPLDEELRRVLPVIEAIRDSIPLPISIDTAKPEVARRALELGASIVNDIGGLRDPAMARVVAESSAGVVIMHMAGTPQTMQIEPRYENVVEDVRSYLARQIEFAESFGISRERIAIDPGIGFGKTTEHNRQLLRGIARFATLGCAVLIGTSRKGFLGKLTGKTTGELAIASVVSSLAALDRGATVTRVHDVGPMVDAIKIWDAVHGWGEDS